MSGSGEADAVRCADTPRTRETLTRDLQRLGLVAADTVLVHSSLKKIGWVCGGAVPLIQALMEVLTPAGTLIMPTQSGDLSEPSYWRRPPVPESWWQIIRDTMPAFDPKRTPTRGMGRVPETFRTWPDVRRSVHPNASFAAWGKRAQEITAEHPLDFPFSDAGPLGKLYAHNARILLLGVGYDCCTALHLAEFRVGNGNQVTQGAPVFENNARVWKRFVDIDGCVRTGDSWDTPFNEIGADFDQTGRVTFGTVGAASCRLLPLPQIVDFAVGQIQILQEQLNG